MNLETGDSPLKFYIMEVEKETQEFKLLLEKHDWFYSMSDDIRVYSRGKLEEREILSKARTNPLFAKMLEDKKNEMFHR